MKILSELRTSDLSTQYQEFTRLLNPRTWQKVASQAKVDIRARPYLKEYFKERHQLALTLAWLDELWTKYRSLPDSITSIPQYQAYTFMCQVLSLSSQLADKSKKSFLGRVNGSFKNPADLKAVIQELEVATHLSRNHFHLDIPSDLGIGSFDWLATRDDLAIDVECKFITRGKGRRIKQLEATETHHLIRTELAQLTKRLEGGLLIRIQLADTENLNKHAYRQRLVKSVKESLLTNNKVQEEWGFVEIQPFDLTKSPFTEDEVSRTSVEEFLSTNFGIVNKEVMAQYSPNKRAAIFSLESIKEDTLLESTFETLEDAARRQLKGTRPGVLCIKFEDISAEQLDNIGSERGEPSLLRRYSSEFLNHPKHKHIASLAFFGDGKLVRAEPSVVTREGSVYFFSNETKWGTDSRLNLFTGITRRTI